MFNIFDANSPGKIKKINMPRVLRIINRFNLGGPTYNAAYLTKYLSPEFDTMLIGGHKDDTEDSSEFILENLGVKPVIIPEMRRSINPFNDYIALKKIQKIIHQFKPDIVHTHASKAGTLGRIAALQSKVPVIVHTFHGHVFHSYFGPYKTRIYQNIERRLANKSSKIIAISENQKYELSQVYNITEPDNIEVVSLGFDLSRFRNKQEEKRNYFREKYHLTDDEIAIGIIGRLVPIKNHQLFLEAFNRVQKKTNRKIRAFIVGDGECRQSLEQKARELNIDYTINGQATCKKATLTFTSWMKNVDVVYAGLDLVNLTSHNEGTPVSLIEAQAANKPVLTTNVGGVENIVLPYITALLAENNNVDDFTEKLLMLINKDKLRQDMSKEGWNYVKEKFRYTRLIHNMSNLYNNLLNNN